MIGVAMRSLAVLPVLIGVLGVVGPQSPAAAVNAGSGEPAIFSAAFSDAMGVSDLRELTTSSGGDRWPAPSPDGSRIAFVRDQCDPACSEALYVMRSDGSDQTELWRPPPSGVLNPYGYPAEDTLGPPSWSPDGTTLLVAEAVRIDAQSAMGSLHLVPLDGNAPRTIGPGWNTVVTGAFSPDGRYVAYQTQTASLTRYLPPWETNDQETVGVIALDGSWRSFGRGTFATWSPRRDRLAYIASTSRFLTVVDPDGRHRWTLRTKLAGGFAWSPAGRQIAFVRNQAGAATFFLARPGSPRSRRVITLMRPGKGPAVGLMRVFVTLSWSRDGQWLAATTDNLTVVVRPDGTGLQPIMGPEGPADGSMAWSPGGHTLAFTGPDGLSRELALWGDPGRSTLLVDQAPPVGGAYDGVAWSPDGTRLIFAREGFVP